MADASGEKQGIHVSTPLAQPTGFFLKFFLAIYHIILAVLLLYLTIKLWPDGSNGNAASRVSLFFNLFAFAISNEIRIILLVVTVGALGSYIHAATSFSDFAGNRTLMSSWAWWYILRPFIGMSLALIFYFVIRAGFLSSNSTSADINPFGFAAVAGMAGMFTKQASDKLRELFDEMFKTNNITQREDPLDA